MERKITARGRGRLVRLFGNFHWFAANPRGPAISLFLSISLSISYNFAASISARFLSTYHTCSCWGRSIFTGRFNLHANSTGKCLSEREGTERRSAASFASMAAKSKKEVASTLSSALVHQLIYVPYLVTVCVCARARISGQTPSDRKRIAFSNSIFTIAALISTI